MPWTALNSAQLSEWHDGALLKRLSAPTAAPTAGAGLWAWIAHNHGCNTLLWDEEDQARRRDVADADIVRSKRTIDRLNQARKDAVEQIDLCLLAQLAQRRAGLAPRPDARLHSETPGAMVDRLSILALKIHHMGLQLRRVDVDDAHLAACTAKLAQLREQRADLLHCLDGLLAALEHGTARFKLYRQFKMYNDPRLNPWLARHTARTAHAR